MATPLIHDWNTYGVDKIDRVPPEFDDETLRDGIQSPSVTDPSIDDKLRILHLMAQLGINAADIGIPASGARAFADVLRLAREIADHGLPIRPNCACRTIEADIEPVIRISQRVGLPLDAYMFIGSSPIRQYAEGWTIDHMLRLSESAIAFALKNEVGAAFVTEDTTRASPDDLERLFRHAVDLGVQRLVLCDTVGHADPVGARNLVRWTRRLLDRIGPHVKIDWHGHNDRGLGVINAISAWAAGADRLHGTGLGMGERVGNAAMDLLLVNLKLMGVIENSLDALTEYAEVISRACEVPLAMNYPVLGADAFRTATGVHAAAIGKALGKNDTELVDRVYSSVPASWVGRRQRVEVGFLSGKWNVRLWMAQHGIDYTDARCEAILTAAKRSKRTLTDADLRAVLSGV
ncbi:MAG: LeuA family protein [Myxococcota bacterium]